ncbi:MAG: SxtJ family membrane protein [Candidatus Binatia bacterium]
MLRPVDGTRITARICPSRQKLYSHAVREVVNGKTLRSFGLTVGGVFALIALWPAVIRGGQPHIWAAVVSVLLIVPAVIWPTSLSRIHKGWMALAEVLAWVNTRIILGAVFYLIVTPIGVVRRLLGKDPMGTKPNGNVESYRILRKPRSASHLTRQY